MGETAIRPSDESQATESQSRDKKKDEVLDHHVENFDQPLANILRRVVAEHGKSLSSQIGELARLCVRGNKITASEYYDNCLFDDKTYSMDEKRRFIGELKSVEIGRLSQIRSHHSAIIADKVIFEKTMTGFGIPVPQTLALVSDVYPGHSTNKLESAEGLHEFLASTEMPVFGKPLGTARSLGTTRIDGYDAKTRTVRLSSGTEASVERIWKSLKDKRFKGYLLQRTISAHPDFQGLAGGGLPTVRCVVIDRGNGPELWRGAAKLPAKGNVADNFWRQGNMLCAVDVETGALGPALTDVGIDGEFISHHPDTGRPIEGVELPFWHEGVSLMKDVARLLPDIKLFGFDTTFTADGPLIVEVNPGPQLSFMQLAHRKGVMDEAMVELVAHCTQLRKDMGNEARDRNKRRVKAQHERVHKQVTQRAA